MCGIAGILLNEMNPAGPAWLSAMTQRLHHRGPDDGGAVAFGMAGSPVVEKKLGTPGDAVDWSYLPMKIGLGARRLAIVDLSPTGHQPMSSPDRRVWLAYNGELYNHAALRDELVSRGMPFTGHSDTEVFLAAYRAWGADCFARFDGMWGAAIVDWAAMRLVLSRDRFGIKPLYLTKFAHGLAFASEIKALFALPGMSRGVNEARLRDFLADGRVDHTDETLFENIWSVPAGTWIEFDLTGRGSAHAGGAVRRFWRPGETVSENAPSDVARGGAKAVAPAHRIDAASGAADSLPARVLATLTCSIRGHLQGDVPIGSCLSGGTDSSAIVSILSALRRGGTLADTPLTQHAFTASMPGSAMDELHYAEIVARACGDVRSHVVAPTPADLLAAMPALVRAQEQPFGSPGIFLQWEVMRAARELGVTVLLDGQGGDELFCGYEGYVPAYLAHLLRGGRISTAAREWRAAASAGITHRGIWKHVVAALAPAQSRDRWRIQSQARRQPWLARDLFSAGNTFDMCRELDIVPAAGAAMFQDATPIERRLWDVLLHDSLPSLLRFEDRNSMAFSVEARVPFLSRDMVSLAMSIPVERKISGGVLKAVLREALRGVVPNEVLNRRDKLGYSVPVAAWMSGGLRAWWRDLVGSKSFAERGCFEPRAIDLLEKRVAAGDEVAAKDLWRLAVVEEWARAFLDRVA